ncbi:MAG TPA: hypothetical protein VEC17_02770 [Candidatus Binatia bacterium]|nr:hypothetical protein [Candidatus Binatia bacterium]
MAGKSGLEPRKSDWGKVTVKGKEYEVVGPGHKLYSYDEPDGYEYCQVCGSYVQYICTDCTTRWCRRCYETHLYVAHQAVLVSEETEMNTL